MLDELIKIKSLTTKIYLQFNESSNSDNLPELLTDYDQTNWDKILNFTRLYYDVEIPDFKRPKQLPKKNASSKPEKDYSAEYEVIMKVIRKIGQKFIQLIHNYRFDRVNPANLEVPQLFYPQKLYNYLRNHHWEKGIPQEFVSEWVRTAIKDFSLTEENHVEFQMVLNKLDLPYSLPEFDAERESEPTMPNSSHETPTQIIRKKSEPKTFPAPIKKVNQVKQVGLDSVPPIENFREFKLWMLKKLDELENIS